MNKKGIRVRASDLDGAIHSTTGKEGVFEKKRKMIPAEECYYTLFGNHDFIDDEGYPRGDYDNRKILAKTVCENGKTEHYIMIGEDGHLANPMKALMTVSPKARLGIKEDYVKCSESMFNNYIQFLKTKNQAWYTQARREVF